MSKHVLVIDDNKLILAITADILTAAGYAVSTAEDVVYCNDIIYGNRPPDLILIDINLPFMNGDHKVRIMRTRPKGGQIPIVLISSISEHELKTRAADCGADGYLTKPIDGQLLLGTVEQILSSKSSAAYAGKSLNSGP
jgi:two-component system chemotaxis response regulator CheY